MSSSFVDQVRAQPWYAQVAAIFAARGVPEYLWISVIRAEDGSLDPTIITNDPTKANAAAKSIGLFQLNTDGLGAHRAISDLQDPVYNAQIAAGAISVAIAGSGSDPTGQLRAVESAGWPGADPSLIAKEEPTRLSDLYSTLKEMGLNALAALVQSDVASGKTAGPVASGPANPNLNTGESQKTDPNTSGPWWWPSLPAFVQSVSGQLLIYGVATTVFVAGISLMRGSSNG